MFSVGLGLIVTFSIGGVKNKKFIKQLRGNINRVRNSFLIYFLVSTVCFAADYYLRQKGLNITTINIKGTHYELNWSVLFCLIMLYSILYFIINFIEIQKLNNDIFDKTNEQDN
jgi:drug/metabolite transporter (DMT)-like permease